jgi:hypothetical protein
MNDMFLTILVDCILRLLSQDKQKCMDNGEMTASCSQITAPRMLLFTQPYKATTLRLSNERTM